MITIDSVPWEDARPFGDHGPTYGEWNRDVLAPLSRQHSYCLCYRPFTNMIDMTDLRCGFCGQAITGDSVSPEAKQLRTQATLTAYPHLAKKKGS